VRGRPIFVSLTTISSRVRNLDSVIGSLLRQTCKPDKILVNVSLSGFMLDSGIRFEQLPDLTRRWATAGIVELYFCENSGPYRKVLPTIRRFRDRTFLLVTADDDVVYPPEWLEVLVRTASEHQCTAAYRCRVISLEGTALAPYSSWQLAGENGVQSGAIDWKLPSRRIFPTGRDGVAYFSEHLGDLPIIQSLAGLAPGQDDITLKFANSLKLIPAVVAPRSATSDPNNGAFTGLAVEGTLWMGNSTGTNDAVLAEVVNWCKVNCQFDFPAYLRD
jgi:hypothetical protein